MYIRKTGSFITEHYVIPEMLIIGSLMFIQWHLPLLGNQWPNRFELVPLLKTNQFDWTEGKPPAFPEPKYWSTSIPVVTKSCLMDVIEIDLSCPTELDYLVFEFIGAYPAFGIVAAICSDG